MVKLIAIDVDDLERSIEAAAGDDMIVRKDQLLLMCAAIRQRQHDPCLPIDVAGKRVPVGYFPDGRAAAR